MALIDTERESSPRNAGTAALRDWLRALEATAPIKAQPRRLLSDVVAEVAQAHGEAIALVSARESLTFAALCARANRYARWALAQKIGKGEVVGLLMPNRPEYLAVWLGLTSVGVVVALLNTQLRADALGHCLDVAAPKHVIVAAEFFDDLHAAAAQLAGAPRLWRHDGDGADGFERLDLLIAQFSGAPLSQSERPPVTIADRALLISTSGTTGLPKAAYVSHRRLLQWSFWFAGLMDTGPADRIYDCLPMYHSVGGVVAPGALLVRGGSVAIREKFSAQEFWDDICDFDCTLFQYIGELARYLLNAPAHRRERAHRLRIACGNGLRADVWEKFRERFAIPRILEFYAATEGNFSLYNVEAKIGAVGRVPSFLRHRFPLALVKFDEEAAAPARGADGFCIRCTAGEVGEAIGRIGAGGEFEGYTGAAETERKILRNVLAPGDAWYRTGDLMRTDAAGFFYFVDRIGDTFRWKGENVSTAEVAAAVAAFPGIKEAAVYGVNIPGRDGSAGMAAIVCESAPDLGALRAHLERRLPAYARPLFLRIIDKIATTATFKHTKTDLVRQGYDPAAIGDAIYFAEPARPAFTRMDGALYRRIVSGKVRL